MSAANRKKSTVIQAVGFIIIGSIVFFFPFFAASLSLALKAALYVGVLGVCAAAFILARRRKPELSIHFLFFLVIQAYYPVMLLQGMIVKLSFPGISYLLPVVTFVLYLIFSGRTKTSARWLAPGRIDFLSILLICGMSVFSGGALVLWVKLFHPDLTVFLEMMPSVNALFLIFAGLGFALTNALVEELFYRGFFMGGLLKIFRSPVPSVFVQAVLFGIWHIRGFPGGAAGVAMVTVWGVFLGVLRRRSEGMLAPYLAHLAADMTIFGILAFVSRL